MRPKPTYRNPFLVIIAAMILLMGCGVSKKTPTTIFFEVNKHSFFESLEKHEKPYSSIYIEKFNLRIDYKGLLRTQKSSLYHVVDSVIYITITSTFSIPVACFYALPGQILIIDKHNKTIYEANYEMLEKLVGFPINFNRMQNLLFGFCDDLVDYYRRDTVKVNLSTDNSLIIASYTEVNQAKSKEYLYKYNFNPQNRLKFIDVLGKDNNELKPQLEVNYTYSKNPQKFPVSSVLLEFTYDENLLELEMEFKNPMYNQPFDIKFDSTYTSRPLFVDHE